LKKQGFQGLRIEIAEIKKYIVKGSGFWYSFKNIFRKKYRAKIQLLKKSSNDGTPTMNIKLHHRCFGTPRMNPKLLYQKLNGTLLIITISIPFAPSHENPSPLYPISHVHI
jgi:hypothetical protein